LGKKGQTEHEEMWTLFELASFFFFMIVLLTFSYTVWKNTTFQKNYLARDMAMTLDTLYISPQKLSYIYPNNVSGYNFIYQGNMVRVGEEDILNQQSDRKYWFADERNRRLDYMRERVSQPNSVLYIISPTRPLVIIADNGNPIVEPSGNGVAGAEE
jgi:hypothetical protein